MRRKGGISYKSGNDADPDRSRRSTRLGIVPRSRVTADRGRARAVSAGRDVREGSVSLQSSTDSGHIAAIGAGTTHAGADCYLPGAGWIAYDPTTGPSIGISKPDPRSPSPADISKAVTVRRQTCRRPRDYSALTVDRGGCVAKRRAAKRVRSEPAATSSVVAATPRRV